MKTRQKSSLKGLWQHCVYICLAAFAVCSATVALAQEVPDSPSPVFISETDSTRALAMNAEDWRGGLPKRSLQYLTPGENSRVIFYVTNLDLTSDEGASAFRVYAEGATGKVYRLTVEDIQPLSKQPWIYGVTVKLYDENAYNGQPTDESDVKLRLTWRGLTSNRVVFGFGENIGKTRNDKGAVPTPAPLTQPITGGADLTFNNAGDRKRFMEQGAFGPSAALDLRLRQVGIRRWIEEQFTKQPTFPYPNLALKSGDENIGCPANVPEGQPDPLRAVCRRDHYSQYRNQNWMFKEALYGDDQLRRRVSWALSQIWVASAANGNGEQQRWVGEQIKILDRHAFGNYRALMMEMTLNPAMGNYLDMVRSTRNNPNENYPREILQLFTIGLDMLNQDGTPVMSGGSRVPTYDQDKVNQFTKVFTGWSLCNNGANPACPNAAPGISNYINPMILSGNTNSVGNNHDFTMKTLFNYPGAGNQVIAACTNCVGSTPTFDANRVAYAYTSLNNTLDNIFYHPNVGPFVGKLLIQHMVTSDPTPAYVARVAAAFNNNGVGVRGDMKAVVRAILLDPEARGTIKNAPDYGKLREPFQYATNLLRTFDAKSAARTQQSDGYINPQTNSMGQNVWYSPTVFNYHDPFYVVPGTDIVGPEFTTLNTGTSFNRINFINRMVYDRINCNTTGTPPACDPNGAAPLGTSLSFDQEIAWASQDATGDILIEGLNQKMMHGAMSQAMKDKIRAALTLPVTTPPTTPMTAIQKARQAVYLVASSSQYQVQR